jgi:hypothetical protein
MRKRGANGRGESDTLAERGRARSREGYRGERGTMKAESVHSQEKEERVAVAEAIRSQKEEEKPAE